MGGATSPYKINPFSTSVHPFLNSSEDMTQYNLRSTNRSQCDSFCETHQEGPDSCSQFLQRTDGDIVLMLLGPTGTGKSTFINCALGDTLAPVSSSVSSCTRDVQVYCGPHPTRPTQRVFLVDTPGFNDTGASTSETQTLDLVARWLIETYSQNFKLSGVLHFSNINTTRISNTDRNNVRVFSEICGPDALSDVVFVSTGWEELDDLQTGKTREQELQAFFSNELPHEGARYRRFPERTRSNACNIIDLFQNHQTTLKIQREIVDQHLPLIHTSASRVMRRTWKNWTKHARSFQC